MFLNTSVNLMSSSPFVRKVLMLASMMFSDKLSLKNPERKLELKNKKRKERLKREKTPKLVEDKKALKNQRFLNLLKNKKPNHKANQKAKKARSGILVRKETKVTRTTTSRLVTSLKKMHLVNICI